MPPDPSHPGWPAEADPYKVLQVDPEADPEIVQAAFRRLAQKYHPDVASDPDAATRMAAINAAWETLRDPGRRAAHDRARGARIRETPSPAVRHDGHTDPGTTPGPVDPARTAEPRPTDGAGRDWTSGRSSSGSGYDPATMGRADGLGAAGPPPGNPSGSVLNFGRYAGWTLGEIARRDLDYVEWLDRMPIGRPYRDEIDAILRRTGRRRSFDARDGPRRGLFRRR